MKRALVLALVFLLPSASFARTWTDSRGRQMEAEFVRMTDDGKVVVRKDGKEVELALAQLGAADRQWLAGQGVKVGAGVPGTTELTHAIRTEDFPAAGRHLTRDLVNRPDLGGYHPLTYAAHTGNPQLVSALLKAGAAPDTVERDGTTALFVAAMYDQPEMIRALHQHGAKYPAPKLHRQPAAAAVRADALESFQLLRKLYPDLDPNAGWPWPESRWRDDRVQEGDDINPYYARSALLFATYAGYDGIARELLAAGANPRTRDTTRREPLHLAAANPRISTEVVAALLNLGADPFSEIYTEHFSPRTPLDFAAAAGSIEKVRALTKGRDPGKHSVAYRRAAMHASAAGQREIMTFLFRELGEAPPTVGQVAAIPIDITPTDSPRPDGKEDHDAITVNPVGAPLPSIRPDPRSKAAPAGSIAVIAPRSLDNHAALLTSALSEIDGLTVVERDDIGRVAEEKLLQHFGESGTPAEGLDLALIAADQLVVIWEVRISGRRFIRANLFSVATRITLMQQVLEFSDADGSWVEGRLGDLLDAIRQGRHGVNRSTALSLIPITPVNRTRECLELARYANLMLPGKVLREPGAALLTLRQMNHLETENAIAGKDSYWKAAWVIEGSLAFEAPGEVSLVLAAAPPEGSPRQEITVRGRPEELAATVDSAWKQLAAKLELKVGDEPAPAPENRPAPKKSEGEAVARQARWFLEAKYPHDAYELANGAYVLGYRDEELLRTMTEAAIDRLSIQQRSGCHHVAKDPRVIEPSVRFSYASALPEFLALCECARLYTAGLDERLISPARPWGGVRSSAYNEIVSHALRELQFFRRMMEDCLIERHYGRELQQLDREIGLLTRDYLDRCRGDASEIDTLRDLMFRRDDNYYGRHSTGLLRDMFDRIGELAKLKPANPQVAQVIRDLAEWCGDPERTCGAEDPIRAFAGKLADSESIGQQWPWEVAQLRAACATKRPDRILALRRVLVLSTDPAAAANAAPDPRCEWERMFDCDRPPHSVQLLANGRFLPPGGIGGLILDPGEGFSKTGEFARLAGWYHDMLRWPRMKPGARESYLIQQIDAVAAQPAAERAASGHLIAVRDLLKSMDLMTPKVASAFGHLLPKDPDPAPDSATGVEGPLALTSLLTLPEKAGKAQFPRVTQATLDGDELWLPATYFDAGGDVLNVQTPPDCHHVIHVIRLSDRSVRTIQLPKDRELDSGWAGPTQSVASDPSILRPVLLGEKHAYFLKSPRPGRLYAIDRRTLEVSAVDLPLPNVIAMSQQTRGDTIYLSVATQWQPMLGRGRQDATAVVAVTGDRITETIVSNQRKPARMPLDEPVTWVDLIHLGEQQLILLSNKEAGYINPEAVKGASRPWDGDSWEVLKPGRIGEVRRTWHESYRERFRTHRNLTVGKSKIYITEDPYDGVVAKAIALVKDVDAAGAFRADWLSLPGKAGDFKLVPVSVKKVVDPQMDRQMFTFMIPPPERKNPEVRFGTMTANELIEAGTYNVRVFGKWRDQYLVFLAGRTVPMPAIWTMSELEFRRQIATKVSW